MQENPGDNDYLSVTSGAASIERAVEHESHPLGKVAAHGRGSTMEDVRR